MYCFLSKKIAMPNGSLLRSVSWNPEHGWIACGGDNGALKILKLEAVEHSQETNVRGVAAQMSITVNEQLPGHNAIVNCVSWNPAFKMFTSSDSTGLIIVWKLYKDTWREEMINVRSQSHVADMRWRGNGNEICIAYTEGAVVVGGVDGSRVWSKELGVGIRFMEWSPDGRMLLFATVDDQVLSYNDKGTFLGVVPLQDSPLTTKTSIMGIEWYDGAEGYHYSDAPSLAFAHSNGVVQLRKSLDDPSPLFLQTELEITSMKWNSNGSVLAVAGAAPGVSSTGTVKFYNSLGVLLTTLSVPGGVPSSLAWEAQGLRLAMSVGSMLYVATVRPPRRFALCGDTLVYAYASPDRPEQRVMFFDTLSEEKHLKYVRNLRFLAASHGFCVLVSSVDSSGEDEAQKTGNVGGVSIGSLGPELGLLRPDAKKDEQFVVILCNSVGSPVDSRYVSLKPEHVVMSETHVILASGDSLFLWNYRGFDGALTGTSSAQTSSSTNSKFTTMLTLSGEVDSRIACIGLGVASSLPISSSLVSAGLHSRNLTQLAASRPLLIACDDGTLLHYLLPSFTLVGRTRCARNPRFLSANCTGNRVAVLDQAGVLRFLRIRATDAAVAANAAFIKNSIAAAFSSQSDSASSSAVSLLQSSLKQRSESDTEKEAFGRLEADLASAELTSATSDSISDEMDSAWMQTERKDVWTLLWAQDSPCLFATMERCRLYIFRGPDPEEPLLSSGVPLEFKNLSIQSVLLDEVMAAPDTPSRASALSLHELRSLRDLRVLLQSNSLRDTASFIETTSRHRRLLQMLADTAIRKLELSVAEKAFIALRSYAGLQFIRRLVAVRDPMRQRALVAVHLGEFDEASALYDDMQRADLKVKMFIRTGNWLGVIRALQSPAGVVAENHDVLLRAAHRKVGDYCIDRQRWAEAIPFYEFARAYDPLIECLYLTENYKRLESLVDEIVGLIGTSDETSSKLEDDADGKTILKLLNSPAVQVSEEQRDLLLRLAYRLHTCGIFLAAARAYLYAGEPGRALDACSAANDWEAASHIAAAFQLDSAESLLQKYTSMLLENRQFMSAVQVWMRAGRFKEAVRVLQSLSKQGFHDPRRAKKVQVVAARATLSGLSKESSSPDTLDERAAYKAFAGARALHFFMNSQRLLYEGNIPQALLCAQALASYEDIVPPNLSLSIAALAAIHSGHLKSAGRILTRLESLPSLSETTRDAVGDLIFSLFDSKAAANASSSGVRRCKYSDEGCKGVTNDDDVVCKDCGAHVDLCVVSGNIIDNVSNAIVCNECRSYTLKQFASGRKSCALCHAASN